MQAKQKNDPDLLLKAQSVASAKNENRYLILTYKSEFSKYHYPLVLKRDYNPTSQSLNRAMNRLASALKESKGTSEMSMTASSNSTNQFFKPDMLKDYNPLKDENELLKKKLLDLQKKKEAFQKGGSKAVQELNTTANN